MITGAYSLYDTKAGIFNTPWFCISRGVAIRMVMDLVSDPQTTINRHPDDYTLFEIGTFDDSNGVLTSSAPVNLGVAASFVVNQQQNIPLALQQKG